MSYRWSLRDTSTGETVVFPFNPNTMSGPDGPNETEVFPASPVDGRHRQWRRPRRPWDWQFGGVLLNQAHHDLMQSWFERSAKLELVDHFGRTLIVRLVAFDPEPRRARRTNLDRYTYTVKTLVYRGPNVALVRSVGDVATTSDMAS